LAGTGSYRPASRIAEDARVATDLPIDLLLGLLSSVLVAVIFIGVLRRVGGDLVLDAFGTSVVVPEYRSRSDADEGLDFICPSVAWATDRPCIAVP
jgi:hypothetical protein